MKTSRVIVGLFVAPLFATAAGLAIAEKPAPVTVTNTPLPVTVQGDPASHPFAKLLCLTDISGACGATGVRPGLPSSFTVPTTTANGEPIKRLVIEFVSGTCIGTGRSTFVEVSSAPGADSQTNPDTGDNFTLNRFPLAFAQYLGAAGVNGAAAYAQAARLYFDPGSVVSMSFDIVAAGGLVCRAQLNGHFIAQ